MMKRWIISLILLFTSVEGLINPYDSDQELTLENLIDIGLRNNPDTAAAWANARAAQATHCQSLSDNFVAIDYAGTGEHDHLSRQGRGNNRSRYTYDQNLAISYLLFDFGRRGFTHQSTFYALKSALYDKNWIIETVVLEVIQRYTAYLDSIATLNARIADMEDAKLTYDVADALYEAGIEKRTDMLQARSDYLESEIQREIAEGLKEVALGRLKNALGVSQMSKFYVKDLSDDFAPYEISDKVEQLLELAKEHRNDLKAAYATVKERESLYKRSVVDGLPSLNVGWSIGHDSGRRPRENYHNVAEFTVSVPIFRGFFFKNGRRRASAEWDREKANLNNALSDAALEVVTNYYAFRTAYRTYEGTIDFLNNAEESYEVALAHYKAGLGSFQAVSDAQSSLTVARSQHIQSKTAWIVSLAQLTYSTGVIMQVENSVFKECSK